MTANVMGSFEALLARELELAFFVPLLIGSGGNSGGQTVSTVIRALGSGGVQLRDAPRVVVKEGIAGLLQASILCCVLAPSLRFGMGISEDVTVVVCLTLLCLGCGANCLGATLTFLIAWTGRDPAVVVGPLMTTTVDSLGLMGYLGIASLYLSIGGAQHDALACKRNWFGACLPANAATAACKATLFACEPAA